MWQILKRLLYGVSFYIQIHKKISIYFLYLTEHSICFPFHLFPFQLLVSIVKLVFFRLILPLDLLLNWPLIVIGIYHSIPFCIFFHLWIFRLLACVSFSYVFICYPVLCFLFLDIFTHNISLITFVVFSIVHFFLLHTSKGFLFFLFLTRTL